MRQPEGEDVHDLGTLGPGAVSDCGYRRGRHGDDHAGRQDCERAVERHETPLEPAAAKLVPAYSCEAGNCGACIATVKGARSRCA